MISILLNFLRLAMWPSLWSILKNVSCTFEKSAFCCWVECSTDGGSGGAHLQYGLLVFPCSSSASLVYLLPEVGHRSLQIIAQLSISPFNIAEFLPHIFCSSDVKWVVAVYLRIALFLFTTGLFLHNSCSITFKVMLSMFTLFGFFQPIPPNLSILDKV